MTVTAFTLGICYLHFLQMLNGKNIYTLYKIYVESDNFLVQRSYSLCEDCQEKEFIEIYVSIFFLNHQSLNKK